MAKSLNEIELEQMEKVLRSFTEDFIADSSEKNCNRVKNAMAWVSDAKRKVNEEKQQMKAA